MLKGHLVNGWEMPKSKKDTRKYPIVYFNTPTRPEPDPLPSILSTIWPDIEKPYLLGTDWGKGKIFKEGLS